jgi:hypothetical protein
MKLLSLCIAWFVLTGIAPAALAPSPLEAFAARPTANVLWSITLGRLDSRDALATFTLVSIEDPATAKGMRGLRIDLAHVGDTPACDWKYEAWQIMCERKNAAVYVEEDRLEQVRNALAKGAAELRPHEYISEYRSGVSGRSAATGLIICGYDFADRRPAELAAIFTQAIAQLLLKQTP